MNAAKRTLAVAGLLLAALMLAAPAPAQGPRDEDREPLVFESAEQEERYQELIRRTVSIEVGMQNSGLAVVLSRNFADLPAAATPGAISAVMHSLIGSALAAFWRQRGAGEERER